VRETRVQINRAEDFIGIGQRHSATVEKKVGNGNESVQKPTKTKSCARKKIRDNLLAVSAFVDYLTISMMPSLIACDIRISEPTLREETARQLRSHSMTPLLVLNTCQRLETFGRTGISPQDFEDQGVVDCHDSCEQHMTRRLARIAAGLESRILGELEILGQVRQAYKEFTMRFGKDDPKLDRLFQKALALARKARRESGIDQNLTGLAALTARKVMASVPEDTPVTIVGSGSLAKGVARYLGKRSKLPVRVSSRCPENAMKLAMEVGGFSSGLEDLVPMLRDARVIVSATAAPHPLIFSEHVPPRAGGRLIVDLGEPPDCAEEIRFRDDIEYVGLLDIEALAQTNTADRRDRAKIAAKIIDEATLPCCRMDALGV